MTWLHLSSTPRLLARYASHTPTVPPLGRRHMSNALHFYSNTQLERYAKREAKRLTLRQLVCFPFLHDLRVGSGLEWRVAGVLWSVHE